MQGGVTTIVRRAVLAAARRTPVLRGLFFQINELRSQNADLRSQNAALRAERDRAISLQLASDRQRDDAEKARWQAVSEREEAEKARWTAVAEREIAERARWAAVRQREHADAALRQALMGPQAPPKQENRANGGSRHPPLERPSVNAAKLNGAKLEPGAKISIVLPNFNHGALLKDNIDGIRAQTYADWELLIVDDGSTDNSRAVIEAAAAQDQRILPIFLPHNRGAMFAAQTALAAASGELLYGSAADDYIVNERFFESVVAMLGRHPEAAGVYGKAVVVDSASGRELWRMGSAPAKEFVPPDSALESFLKGGIFVPGAAAIWKRALFDSLGGFDPELGPQTDFFINHALPIAAGAVYIDEVVAVVRAGAGNYHRAASDEDFFRRHALVEIKLRALKRAQPIDPIWLRIWRDRLINSHLAVTRQQQIYASLRGTLTNIEAWEREGLPAGFEECSARVLAQVGAWQDDLDKRVSAAHDVFDALAGPLGLGMVKPARGSQTAAPPEAAR
jgi:glycosyltransferase involved in cell wall biosynthesis